MEVEIAWERPLCQFLNKQSVKVIGQTIVFTEGLHAKGPARLSCCHVETGELLWSTTVPDTWGWTEAFAGKIYYVSQSDILTVMDIESGEIRLQVPLPGRMSRYVVVTPHALFTGGWRGYSDFRALDPNTLEEKWGVAVSSREIQKIAVPVALTEEIILLANHTKGTIELRDTNTGRMLASDNISADFRSLDLAQSCQVVGDNATFLSKHGLQLTVNVKTLKIETKQLNVKCSETVLPLYSLGHMIVVDGSGNYKMYNRNTDEIIWEIRIENNSRERTLAAFLCNDYVLLGGSTGQLKLLNGVGEEIGKMKSFRRIGTELMTVGNQILFGAKSEIAAVRWIE